jgi:hypothetical protein
MNINTQKSLIKLMWILPTLLVLGGVFSYVGNVIKVTNCDFESDYKCEVIHGVGVIVPPAALITVWFEDDSVKDTEL